VTDRVTAIFLIDCKRDTHFYQELVWVSCELDDYATQDNRGAVIKADAKAAGAAISDYLGDVFIRGDLEATASWSGAMLDIATIGLATNKVSKLAKVADEAPTEPKPNKDVP
jgi:hypothetical protein